MELPIYLTKSFSSKQELHKFLFENKDSIVSQKKSGTFKAIEKGAGVSFVGNELLFSEKSGFADKARDYGFKSDYIYPVINSTGWMDSHFDVHIKGCYKKTVPEQQGKVYFIDTHLKGLANIITKRENVNMMVKDIDWKMLGKDTSGSTECLVFEIAKDNVRKDALEFIESTPDLENSLAMRYINVELAMKSNDSAFKEENERFNEYISQVNNNEIAEHYGFFWAVKELAIMGEGSICPVVGGSNSATRVIQLSEPSNHSEQPEPSIDTQKEDLSYLLLK